MCVCVCVCVHVHVCVCVYRSVRGDMNALVHVHLTNFMIIVLVCDTEHIGHIPVSLSHLVMTADMPTEAVEDTMEKVDTTTELD